MSDQHPERYVDAHTRDDAPNARVQTCTLYVHLNVYKTMSMLGVDKCCKRQTLLKSRNGHRIQTECLECSKTRGRPSGTPPLLWARQASRLHGIHHLLLGNLTTGPKRLQN